ncbi:hypothetical protein, partial [Nafulsella turpanensis]|uniref:hypothetical protein n=1 Tax=Nafulsella turpanensis TaxID=1265690 RepID=UPI001F179968
LASKDVRVFLCPSQLDRHCLCFWITKLAEGKERKQQGLKVMPKPLVHLQFFKFKRSKTLKSGS